MGGVCEYIFSSPAGGGGAWGRIACLQPHYFQYLQISRFANRKIIKLAQIQKLT